MPKENEAREAGDSPNLIINEWLSPVFAGYAVQCDAYLGLRLRLHPRLHAYARLRGLQKANIQATLRKADCT